MDIVTENKPVRVGIVGFGWMGQVHARAYSRLVQYFPSLPPIEFVAVADNATDSRLAAAVEAYGFHDMHADWRELVSREDIDLVSVTGPNFVHRDVGVAVAQAGKHLWIEKPAGRDSAETREIADAVAAAGVQSAAGFNYRNAPALELARSLVRDGRLGTVETVDVTFLSDYAARPDGALTWRYQNQWAGSGVLGDLVSHAVDLARYVVDEISEVVADSAVFIAQRPQSSGTATGHGSVGTGPMGAVENEDHASALLRFAGGARGRIESSRVAVGEQNRYGIEVHGDRGALAWDFRRMGELQVCLDQDVVNASYQTSFAKPGDGEFATFQPGPGIAMSFDDLKVIECSRLLRSIATGQPVGATIADALVAAEIVDALAESLQQRRWVRVGS